nr:Zinc finger CCCH domain containing protein [Hymenolepis microstoma]
MATFEIVLSRLKSVVTCDICQGIFSSPLFLKCGHTFCFRCIWPLFAKGPVINCATCGVKTYMFQAMLCKKAREVVELLYKYSPTTFPINSRGMTNADYELAKRTFFRAPIAVSRYSFHKNSMRCTFPYKWMAIFAKKIGQSGYPFFIYEKLRDLLQPVLTEEQKEYSIVERCKKWPHCGDSKCEYIHPFNPCTYGDACQERDKCLLLHGEDYLHIYTVVESKSDLCALRENPLARA